MIGPPNSANTRLYNLITVIMLILTFVVCLVVVILAINPPSQARAQPTVFVFPTDTPTLAGPTLNPTWTVSPTATVTGTPAPTVTPRPSITPTPSDTPTPTNTLTPTPTPTATFTPTNSPTPTVTPTNTQSPFDYVLQKGEVRYTQNFANSAGCDWAGIAGEVFDIKGNHKLGLIIHVYGGGIDERLVSGSATAYGASGWERSVGNKPSSGLFHVQLEASDGTLLSAVVDVQMIPSCSKNLALVNFVQVQE